MLGKVVDVLIDRSAYGHSARFCSPFYCGHIINADSPLYKKDVYVMSNNPDEKFLKGIIIAIANKGSFRSERIIVAPIGSIYYSPEIRNRLSRIRNQNTFKLSCLYEKSWGAIVYEIRDHHKYFLLVKNKNGKHWGFPKGHIEVGETEEQTAKREIKEETNLDVKILHGFRKKAFIGHLGELKKRLWFSLLKPKIIRLKFKTAK